MLLLDYMKENYAAPAANFLAELLGLDDADSLDSLEKTLDGKTVDLERKNALLERSVEILLTPERMASRLSCLSDEEMALFERACKGPVKLEKDEQDAGREVQGSRYAFLVLPDDEEKPQPSKEPEENNFFSELQFALKRFNSGALEVPEDVAALYNSINTPEFQERRRRAYRLTQCLDVCGELYVSVPVSVVCRMMEKKLGESISEEEVLSLYHFLPRESTYCSYDSALGRFTDRHTREEARDEMIQKQEGKDFYIPSPAEVEDLFEKGYLPDTLAYTRYRDFLEKYAGFDSFSAAEAIRELWGDIAQEKAHQKNLQDMIEQINADYTLSKLLITLYHACLRETRVPYYCGHTLTEMQANNPDFTPDYFPEGQYDLTFNHGANTTRVGRNDPCPCGSGKKFKKCCMR